VVSGAWSYSAAQLCHHLVALHFVRVSALAERLLECPPQCRRAVRLELRPQQRRIKVGGVELLLVCQLESDMDVLNVRQTCCKQRGGGLPNLVVIPAAIDDVSVGCEVRASGQSPKIENLESWQRRQRLCCQHPGAQFIRVDVQLNELLETSDLDGKLAKPVPARVQLRH
jgi:hypothetical protein